MSRRDPRVDDYIDGLPAWQQDVCRRVRDNPHAAHPQVVETIKRTLQPYFVLNGDSYCEVDYAALQRFHEDRRATLSMVVAPPGERHDVGTVQLAGDGRIVSFSEKSGARAAINGGVYLMGRSLIDPLPAQTPLSLERDVFPEAVPRGGCYGFTVPGPVVDIGTPERYRAAQELLRDA